MFEAINGMLLDMLEAVARKDYRTPPTVFRPPNSNPRRILVEWRTCSRGVSSGSFGPVVRGSLRSSPFRTRILRLLMKRAGKFPIARDRGQMHLCYIRIDVAGWKVHGEAFDQSHGHVCVGASRNPQNGTRVLHLDQAGLADGHLQSIHKPAKKVCSNNLIVLPIGLRLQPQLYKPADGAIRK